MQTEDTDDLLAIKRRVFGERRADADLWRHRYYSQPWGELPGVVTEIDGQIVGSLSAISRKVQLDGIETLSVQHADAMVTPEARGHSLYKRMLRDVCAYDREAGAGLLYGLPNRLSAPRLLSPEMGWVQGFRVPAYARVVRPDLLASALPGLPARLGSVAPLGLRLVKAGQSLPLSRSGSSRTAVVSSAPEDADDLWQRARSAFRFQTVRDREYLRWRYDDNPGGTFRYIEVRSGGRLRALAVVTEQEFRGVQALVVVDWLVEAGGDNLFGAILARANELAVRSPHVGLVLLFALPPYSGSALRGGFWRIPDRLLPAYVLFCFHPEGHSDRQAAALAQARNWHFTFGDSDLV